MNPTMNVSRRTVLQGGVALALGVMTPGLAACGGGSESSGSNKLTIAARPHFIPQLKDLVKRYKAVEPSTSIELQTLPDSDVDIVQRLSTGKLGGLLPDIFENLDTLVNQLAANKVTQDLTSYLANGKGLAEDDFASAFLGQYRPLDLATEVHGLPVGADATVLFFNKTVFEKFGVAMPSDGWTWDDMWTASKAITQAGDGEYYGLVMSDPWQAIYNPLIASYGGYVYDPDSNTTGIGEDPAIQAWTELLTPYTDGTIAPYTVGSANSAPTFEGGKVGMEVLVRVVVPVYRESLKGDTWDVVQLPTINGTRPVGGGSYGLSMTSTSQVKDAAWRFLLWFYDNDGGMKVLESTYSVVPPTKDGVTSGSWLQLPPPPANNAAFAAAVGDAIIAPALPGRAQAVLDDAVSEATQNVLLKDADIAESFHDAADKVNAALEDR